MFDSHTDYHGTRRYTAEKKAPGADGRGVGGLSILGWFRLQIEKFLRAGAPASRTTWLMRRGEKHFTMLGSPSARERPITDIFPVAEAGKRHTPGHQRGH
jgi:hypothetical protein